MSFRALFSSTEQSWSTTRARWPRTRPVLASVWLLWLAPLAALAPLSQPNGEEIALIRQVFEGYKAALIAGDGAAAAAQVDRATLEYFADLKQLASSASREQIEQRPFIDRLLVVSIRHVLEPGKIEKMNLEELIELAVGEGWISPATIQQLEMGTVTIDGDRASGEVLTAATTVGSATSGPNVVEELRYRFQREEGEWRFGFSSLVAGLNQVISDFTRQLGTNEDDLIFVLVEAFSGRKVLPDVWRTPE